MRSYILIGMLMACSGNNSRVPDAAPADGPVASPDGPPDAAPSQNALAHSGSRLKLSWYQTADGVRSPIDSRFYDATLTTECLPVPWTSDGKQRCLPENFVPEGDWFYSDPSCTTKIYALQTQSTVPPTDYTVRWSTMSGCQGSSTVDDVWHAGDEITSAPVYWQSASGCIAYAGPPTMHFYKAVELPPSSFVEIATTYDTTTGSIQQMQWDSADGMRWLRPGGYDTALADRCSYEQPTPSTVTCIPDGTAVAGYADSTCTMPVTSVGTGCATPKYAVSSLACPTDVLDVYPVGAAVTPSALYESSGASCTATTKSNSVTYFTIGASASHGQSLTRDRDMTAPTRLQPIFMDTSGGVHYQTGIFWDTTLGIECAFGATGATTGLCGPTGKGSIKSLFSDPSCSTPIDVAEVDDVPPPQCPPTAPYPPPAFGWKITGTGTGELHRLTTQHTAVVYQQATNCIRYPELGSPITFRLFDIDPAVTPASVFETSTIVIDP